MALTHLADEMPMLVNADDFGGPMNYIHGGRYEDENLSVLLSFLRDDSVFLDIGANLGFFALKLGQRLRRHGRVLAFEPHPHLAALLRRSLFLNGLDGVVTLHEVGLSDANGPVAFSYPRGHLGGGGIGRMDDAAKFETVAASVRRLDDLVEDGFVADLVKIDVEGHELAVLRGMAGVIARSPGIRIMFEKLGRDVGNEAEVEAFCAGHGLTLYAVQGDAQLVPLPAGGLASLSGYALASRPAAVGETDRRRFSVFASQLFVPGGAPLRPGAALARTARRGEMLFHGPYWFLPRGVWQLRLHGGLSGDVEITLAERFGFAVQSFTLAARDPVAQFVSPRDLVQFELIARPAGDAAAIDLASLELVRVG